MSEIKKEKLAPFATIFLLVVVGLFYVFVKMEIVDEGYQVVRLAHQQRVASSERASMQLTYARLTRPERLDLIGTTRLALAKAQKEQVVLMAANGTLAIAQ